MKRLIALLLVLVLLAGCTVQEPEPTTVPTTEATEPSTKETDPPGTPLYIQNSELEQQTAGAVKTYGIHKDCMAVYPMGENLLAFFPRQPDADQIHIYGGEELYLRGTARPDSLVTPGTWGVQISENGISYYHESLRQIVLLDAGLTEIKRVDLPENARGTAVVDPQQKYAYFCTENEIRVLDLETGIARLLRQEAVEWQRIYDVCFDGRVLLCDVIDSNQSGYLAYIDTSNGRLLGKGTGGVDTFGDAFLVSNGDGSTLYGTWDTEVQELDPVVGTERIWNLLPLGGALAVRTETDGLVLDFYTLESGLRTASVMLPGAVDIYSVVADLQNNCVWFLMEDDSEERVLCHWDPEMSAVADETVYLLPRYTEQFPDVEGLNRLQTEADLLAAANSMEIRIWKDAVTEPWEDLDVEYRVSSFREGLDAVEQVLAAFPEGMTAKVAALNDSGKLPLSLVGGASETAQGYLEWYNGSVYLAVETGDGVADAFCNALYRAMDTYILNSNSILDEWNSKEPVKDRAMIFQYAMADGMEDYFESKSAQSKLKQLCKAIRDAFDLKKYEGELLWEQYLED